MRKQLLRLRVVRAVRRCSAVRPASETRVRPRRSVWSLEAPDSAATDSSHTALAPVMSTCVRCGQWGRAPAAVPWKPARVIDEMLERLVRCMTHTSSRGVTAWKLPSDTLHRRGILCTILPTSSAVMSTLELCMRHSSVRWLRVLMCVRAMWDRRLQPRRLSDCRVLSCERCCTPASVMSRDCRLRLRMRGNEAASMLNVASVTRTLLICMVPTARLVS
mmetsp:Transcript_6219/g.13584  ORF Transcript_6219/g.13584 Transcript_6219/m.13584 type:complete len:219 (-) Transcript_6219:1428-2084(-)